MKTYPPVDPDFYAIAHKSGMNEEEIQNDWKAYCDDLEKFYSELDSTLEPAQPNPVSDSVEKIKEFFN